MNYLSVCSGIEAATVAWHPLGWKPVAFADIEPFPSAVLAHHYPTVPNHGDMSQFSQWPDHAIDLLVGGTPCQAFSIAGLRKGLDDPRGNLTLTFLALARRYQPRWLVWENVPGVLSVKGNPFGQFLAGLAELGYGCAYRVLDAQYFGVAQRRRRVFVVGHLGAWQPAAAVLLEPESLRGDSSPRRQTRENTAPTLSARTHGGGGLGTDAELDGAHQAVAYTLHGADKTVRTASETEVAGSIRTKPPGSIENSSTTAVLHHMAVRRLTPRECERLQGFPDDYTRIPWRGKPAETCPDGPRYKALGNSMAVPVMHWMGQRIAQVTAILNVHKEAAA